MINKDYYKDYPYLENTVKLLDKINMSPLFRHNMTIQELADLIEEYVTRDPELSQEIDNTYFAKDVFNWMDDYELMDYIHSNYGVRFVECVEYRLD